MNFRTWCTTPSIPRTQPPRLTIQSDGTRMSSAYGHTGKGRYLDEYLGARLAPIVMPVYYECIAPPPARLHHRQYRRHLWPDRRL